MAKTVVLKSKATGLIGVYPKSHAALDSDLVPVDSDGNVCVPCMAGDPVEEKQPEVVESVPTPVTQNKTTGKDK